MRKWCEMRYENFDGAIEELVRIKIKEIEEKEKQEIALEKHLMSYY